MKRVCKIFVVALVLYAFDMVGIAEARVAITKNVKIIDGKITAVSMEKGFVRIDNNIIFFKAKDIEKNPNFRKLLVKGKEVRITYKIEKGRKILIAIEKLVVKNRCKGFK